MSSSESNQYILIFPNHVLIGFNPLNFFFIDDQIKHLWSWNFFRLAPLFFWGDHTGLCQLFCSLLGKNVSDSPCTFLAWELKLASCPRKHCFFPCKFVFQDNYLTDNNVIVAGLVIVSKPHDFMLMFPLHCQD